MSESRRDVIAALNILIEDDSKRVSVNTFQKRPNTFAVARFSGYVGIGFSKVCYPDTWDGEKGVEIAMRKAIQDVGDKFWKGNGPFNLLVQAEKQEQSFKGE